MGNNVYTGRVIGLFADAHALLEPVTSVLEDMKKKKITEIYSLGDNIGVGPNPSEVMEILNKYNVVSIAGNSEEYCTLGIEPFSSYFTEAKTASFLWTYAQLNEEQKEKISKFPHSIELTVGNKKIALCHFANDVRFDYDKNSTWTYQKKVNNNEKGYIQFLYTNSLEQKSDIKDLISFYGKENGAIKGILSSEKDPIFSGKTVDNFDYIFQGHVHFKIYEESETTAFYSIRAVGMAYGKDSIDTASYIMIKEKIQGGFDIEEVLVKYDRKKMEDSILKSSSPDHTIEKFVSMEDK